MLPWKYFFSMKGKRSKEIKRELFYINLEKWIVQNERLFKSHHLGQSIIVHKLITKNLALNLWKNMVGLYMWKNCDIALVCWGYLPWNHCNQIP
jgi:hypothetical protein